MSEPLASARPARWPSALSVLVAVCSGVLLAPLVMPALTGRVFVYNDLSWFHLPMRYLYQEALRAGDSVLWTPSIFAGFYLHGEGQTGVFHPLHQFLYRVLPLGTAFNLELVLSYPAAFAGMFCFLRRLRLDRVSSLFGAMLFAFSGFNLLHHHHMNMVAIVAHMPWLLTAADVLIVDERRRPRTLAFAAIAIVIGSAFLIGFPQAVLWNLIALGGYAIFRAGETGRWRQLWACAAAVGLGTMLGALQLLPSLDAAAGSTRIELPRDFALDYSLHPYNLVQLWSPYFFTRGAYSTRDYMWFHEFGIYSGAVSIVAWVWVLHRWQTMPERRHLITAVSLCAVAGLVLALGRYGGVAWLFTFVPGLDALRAPVRFIVLVQFALAILVAVMIEDLLAIANGRRRAPAGCMVLIWTPAALGILTTMVLNSGLLPYGRLTFASASAAAPGVAIVAAVTLLVWLAGRRNAWALAALIVITAADLWGWSIAFIQRVPARAIHELTAGVTPAPPDPAESYAVAPDRGPFGHDRLVLQGYRLTSGYVGLYPATTHPLDSDEARRLSGTRWVFTEDGVRHPVQDSAARVRLLDDQHRPATGSVQLDVDRPGHLVVTVDAPGPRILAFTERFHDGWWASAGDTPLEVVRIEGDFLGCRVEAGIERVELGFTPRSFVYGAVVSAMGLVLLAGALAARLR